MDLLLWYRECSITLSRMVTHSQAVGWFWGRRWSTGCHILFRVFAKQATRKTYNISRGIDFKKSFIFALMAASEASCWYDFDFSVHPFV